MVRTTQMYTSEIQLFATERVLTKMSFRVAERHSKFVVGRCFGTLR